MIILLSPAKTLDFTRPVAEAGSRARFEPQATAIAAAASRLGAERLAEVMHVSPRLAELTAARFAGFATAADRPAIRAFAGDVYRGFDAASADPDTLAFAQAHLRILSGLYGVLRPLDRIRPYRLEMGLGWSPDGSGRLVDHWGGRIAGAILADLEALDSRTIVNLASGEYFEAVGPHLPPSARVIAPDFRIATERGLAFHSFAAKVARGRLARFLCERRASDPAAILDFSEDGWSLDRPGSSPDRPLFVRQPAARATANRRRVPRAGPRARSRGAVAPRPIIG